MNESPGRGIGWREALLIGGAAIAGVGLFALAERYFAGGWGFPLDDSWIHLQFARNLRAGQGFSFNPGELSAGSTAPLWTLVLSLLFRFPWDPLLSVKVVGAVLLAVNGWLTWEVARAAGLERRWALLAGVTIVLTPRLLWASLSGMEVMLYVSLATAAVWRHLRTADREPSLTVTGLLALAALARPECLMLFPLAMFDRWPRAAGWRRFGQLFGKHLLLYLVLLAPFIWHNYQTIGKPLPNTFYAKVGGHGLLGASGGLELERVGRALFLYPLLQAQELMQFSAENSLLLTFLTPMGIVELIRRRKVMRGKWLMPLSLLAFPLFRGMLAPFKGAVFQQGRYAAYLVPLLTVVGLIGLKGAWNILQESLSRPQIRLLRRWGRVAIWGLMVLNLVALDLRSARIYGQNVRDIEVMHVAMGKWLAEHTDPEAVVAANDIGAIGFFSGRRVLDVVGLVSPGVLPFLKTGHLADEGVLHYLQEQKPDYLVILPNWYPELSRRADLFQPVHEIVLETPTIAGGPRMVVYRTIWAAAD